ncbi:restriction endonuclease subunit S [Serratia fonticola]|uniref:restriction endonuclease subunit S n=1 Tax=Serratia fonticola TaxID=47917 RepID=UPI00192B3B24|nr:restriction endonuclease subunit S [Serratia fonticola]MBL5863596.1 restriction endonuclease subunit S [Serratia fonticola]
MTVEKLLTDHIDIWSSALQTRSTAGRGSNGKIDLYGIKKLRELILELAVRGKLVPQDPNDESASELLKRIAAEKAELVKQGKIKKQKPLPEIREDEKPFELPVGWEWVRLSEAFYLEMGQSPSSEHYNQLQDGIPFFQGKADFGDVYPTARYWCTLPSKLSEKDDVLLSVRAPVGPTNLSPYQCCIGRGLAAIRCLRDFSHYYLLFVFRALQPRLEALATGTTFSAISKSDIEPFLIPVPSFNEQLRIVSKVNELMSFCDRLEQQSLSSLDAHQQLVETLLATLTDSQNGEELAENWARISQHFNTLFTTEVSIDALKQTILQLAVMGKLVSQDPNDEPASELLKRIEQEKAQLVREGKIKKQKPLPPVSDEETFLVVPERWTICRLQEVTNLITDGKHGDCNNRVDSGYYFLSAKDINDGKLNYTFARQIEHEEFLEVHNRTNLQVGDICMVNTGATVGKLAIVDDVNLAANTTFQKSVAVIKPCSPFVCNLYIYLFLESQTLALRMKSGGSAINNLLLGDLKRKLTPLPPLKEQYRIVNKVNELNKLCDHLKSRLQSAQQTQLQLADALTDAALN